VTICLPELREAERWSTLVPGVLWLLEGRPVRLLVLGCSNVVAMSSMFFGQMIRLRKALASRTVQLRICGLSPAAREAFQICKLDKIIPVYESPEDALTA
jgi:anti-anti-sigma factor